MGRPKNKYSTDSKLYSIRQRMLTKCFNNKNKYYEYFGAKGITVCEEWVNSYKDFYLWANSNGYEDGLTILRRDENKDFTPDNCVFGKYERTTHGMSKSRIYRIRREMIHRCHNEKSSSYKGYGAKGIKVCKEWRENFENFWEWASLNGYSDELTIDRINPKLGYSPENCRWVSPHEQVLNQERNKSRAKEDKYIKFLNDGRFQVIICKGGIRKRKVQFSKICKTLDEAVKERDYFIENGTCINHENPFKSRKRKCLLPRNKIGYKILMILVDRDMKVSELADKLNVSRQATHDYIYKNREPKRAIFKVASVLNMPVEYFTQNKIVA